MKIKLLKENLKDLDPLLEDAQRVWNERGETTDIRGMLMESMSQKSDAGWILYEEDGAPVGVVSVTYSSDYYGGVTVHGLTEAADKAIAELLVNKGVFEDRLVELGSIKPTLLYKTALGNPKNMIVNERQRMGLWLDKNHVCHVEPMGLEGVVFHQMGTGFDALCGELSYHAHKVSRDYYMNPEMNTLSLRINLEKEIQTSGKVEFDPEASAVAVYNNMLIGFCTIAYIECWGQKKVPWIFDLSVHPDYHGKGVGRELLKSVINGLIYKEFTIMGLAVTKTNPAKYLYENLGFTIADEFYEFLMPVTWDIPDA